MLLVYDSIIIENTEHFKILLSLSEAVICKTELSMVKYNLEVLIPQKLNQQSYFFILSIVLLHAFSRRCVISQHFLTSTDEN